MLILVFHNLLFVVLLFKLLGFVVQLVPSYNSVAPVFGGAPPKAKAAVCVPAPPIISPLAVFKLPGLVAQVNHYILLLLL
jgi:hypothetical protein